jgi:radical SAM protein with 4Fe4S-binding SPASM domain
MLSKARSERIPLQAELEIIATCNFKCVHCYIAPCAERGDEMSVAQAQVIFEKLAAAGTMVLLLTGGEVLTHRHFREIYLAAKRMGFVVYVNTNAYLIGEKWADFFAEWPPETLSISIYGSNPDSYERLTGIPRSYERCMRAIDLLLDRGVKMEVKCPAMTITLDELPVIQAWARSKGLKFRTDHNIMPQEKGGTQPLQLQLAPKDVLDLQRRLDPDLEEQRRFAKPRVGADSPFVTDKVYLCGAGQTNLAINVFGGVTTCLTSRKVVGNLLEQTFEEVWAALGGKVAVRYPEGHPCATCRFHGICAGCPATVESLTGLPTGYVQLYCKMTHMRAYEMGYHPTGIPRTVTEGIPAGVRTPDTGVARMLPVLN